MNYIYKEGNKELPLLVMLHGTGGDERQMMPLASSISPESSVLSVRGNVSENGMNRYFKRKAEGVYDVEDLHFRGKELLDWIVEFGKENDLDLSQAVFVGFSNGSNIAMNMMLREDTLIHQGILLAPMYPVEVPTDLDLSSTRVFLSMGENDPICTVQDSENVISIFERGGAEVTTFWVNSHEVTQASLDAAKEWLIK